MSDTDDTNRGIQVLREREAEINRELASLQHRHDILHARLMGLLDAIDIVERNGRKKPGPKAGGTRLATAELASVAADAEHEP